VANQSIGAPGKGANVANVANPENWKTFGRNISKILEHLNLFHLEGWDMPKRRDVPILCRSSSQFFPVLQNFPSFFRPAIRIHTQKPKL